MYQRKIIYNNSVPLDMLDEFFYLIKTCECLGYDYLIEGTNITINELMSTLELEDNEKRGI